MLTLKLNSLKSTIQHLFPFINHVRFTSSVVEAGGSNRSPEAEEENLSYQAQIDELVANDQGPIPVEHFFQNPEKRAFRLSPSGKYLAWLAPYQNRLNVHVRQLGDDQVTRLTDDTNRDILRYGWANDRQIFYLQDDNGNENDHLHIVNIEGGEVKDLTPFENVKCEIVDRLKDNPDEIIVKINKDNKELFEPYRLNTYTGELTKLAENSYDKRLLGYFTDHKGQVRAALGLTDSINFTLFHRSSEDEPFQPIRKASNVDMIDPQLFTFDNRHLYVLSNINRDKIALVQIDTDTGDEVELIYSDPEYDLDSVSYSKKRQTITSVNYTSWKQEKVFFDQQAEQRHERLQRKLGENAIINIVDNDLAEETFVVHAYSDRSPGTNYLYDETKDELTKLADMRPQLDEEEMAPVEPVQYQSRDGWTIHGYLTTPKRKEAKNLPVVVFPHGGPDARDFWGFHPFVQFIASRGYAVFQMNFRGSTGYGKAFWQAHFKEFGHKMQDDITDGVHWLIDKGIADPERIAIFGISYGGYAALAGAAFTPDLYRCVIDYCGPSNLFTSRQHKASYLTPLMDWLYEKEGHPERDKDYLMRASPYYHVDSIKAPLFVIQGAQDPRVVKNESDQIVQALRDRGVNVPYMVKEDEGHGFMKEENRFESLRAIGGFLRKHMEAKPVGI